VSSKAESTSELAHALTAAPLRPSLLPRQLSEDEFALFARVGVAREVSQGEVIFRRGELGRSMFIVEAGQVQL
jgi:CRP-like cAMP-binding protein